MDIKKQQRAVVDALEDVKAQDIHVYNTEALTGLFDRVVIATATSNRQTRALAHSVEDKARELGLMVIATEGLETGEWVLVDLGDIVVHIMQQAIRQYYNLEEIWGGKPVRMKLGSQPASPTAIVTSASAKPKPPTKTARKTATKTPTKTPTKRASKTANKTAGAPASRTAARKSTGTKTQD